MTPEEKVAILKEAGVWDVIGFPSCIDKLFDLVAKHERNRHAWTQEHWTQYEHAIAAAEREACAKVCEDMIASVITRPMPLRDIVAAIRARGQ